MFGKRQHARQRREVRVPGAEVTNVAKTKAEDPKEYFQKVSFLCTGLCRELKQEADHTEAQMPG